MIIEQNEIVLLLHNVFRSELIEKVAVEHPRMRDDVDLCLAFKKHELTSQQPVSRASQECSTYIIKASNEDFYSKVLHVYLHIRKTTRRYATDATGCVWRDLVDCWPNIGFWFVVSETVFDDINSWLWCHIDWIAQTEKYWHDRKVFTANDEDTELITFSYVNLNKRYGRSAVLNYNLEILHWTTTNQLLEKRNVSVVENTYRHIL